MTGDCGNWSSAANRRRISCSGPGAYGSLPHFNTYSTFCSLESAIMSSNPDAVTAPIFASSSKALMCSPMSADASPS